MTRNNMITSLLNAASQALMRLFRQNAFYAFKQVLSEKS